MNNRYPTHKMVENSQQKHRNGPTTLQNIYIYNKTNIPKTGQNTIQNRGEIGFFNAFTEVLKDMHNRILTQFHVFLLHQRRFWNSNAFWMMLWVKRSTILRTEIMLILLLLLISWTRSINTSKTIWQHDEGSEHASSKSEKIELMQNSVTAAKLELWCLISDSNNDSSSQFRGRCCSLDSAFLRSFTTERTMLFIYRMKIEVKTSTVSNTSW